MGWAVWLGGLGGWLTPEGLAGLHGKGSLSTKGQTVLFEHETRTVPVCLLPAAFWALVMTSVPVLLYCYY